MTCAAKRLGMSAARNAQAIGTGDDEKHRRKA